MDETKPHETAGEVCPHRRPVFLTDVKVCFLVHRDTGRILCAARHDGFAKKIARISNCKVVEIRTAHDYDLWSRKYCKQRDEETAEEDARYLEREQYTRRVLRQQLRDRLQHEQSGEARKAIDSALHCLDVVEERRRRYRSESFIPQEGFENKTNAGEEIINNLSPKEKT